MSTVDVFVAEPDLEDAKLVMLVTEVDSVLDLPPQRERPSSGVWDERALWLVLVAIALLGIIPIVHMATSR